MNYQSTRDADVSISSAEAIRRGISADGGLFVPREIPRLSFEQLNDLCGLDYKERAAAVLKYFLTDYSDEELEDCVSKAYDSGFEGPSPAPLQELSDGVYMLELWHGPTCAFKDMALQLLPHLLTYAVKKTGNAQRTVILVATSGDTGKAALEGFADVPGTDILVFYPQDGVSAMQKLQMTTQHGDNVGVCAMQGNFDDAQTGVKRLFNDSEVIARLREHGMEFSSANSINWGRLAPQIVYYISAYCDLLQTGRLNQGEGFNIVVPTGNFGNILAAYYARQMGVPIHKLLCASNANNVLTEFLRTGVYDRNRCFYTTLSPSMDILVSSNLERLLFDLTGRDAGRVSGWMDELARSGRYEVDDDIKEKLQELFWAECSDDEETKRMIRVTHENLSYLCDPHTAVALSVFTKYIEENDDDAPVVIASTASPYKFAGSVLAALNPSVAFGGEFAMVDKLYDLTGVPVPQPIADLNGRESRFDGVCTGDGMQDEVYRMLGIEDAEE